MCASTPRVTNAAPVQNATGLWKLIPVVTAPDYVRGRCEGCNSRKAVGAKGAEVGNEVLSQVEIELDLDTDGHRLALERARPESPCFGRANRFLVETKTLVQGTNDLNVGH